MRVTATTCPLPTCSSSGTTPWCSTIAVRLLCVLLVFSWILDQPVLGLPDSPIPVEDLSGRGSKKFGDDCEVDNECGFAGSYCEPKKKKCACKEEFEATNHIDKCGHAANVNESCFFHEQCEIRVLQTECRDGRCICLFEKIPMMKPDGVITCVAEIKEPPNLQYIDPAMIGVLVGMALMFIIICVVLRLFSKARWRENRTIFNTPNTRLMNVSLLRENKLLHAQERRGSRASVRAPSRQPSMASLRAQSPNASQGAKQSHHSQHRVFMLKVILAFRVVLPHYRAIARDTLARKSLSPGSRTGSRRGSRTSSGNASAASVKSNKSPNEHHTNNDSVQENVTVEVIDAKV